MESMAVLGFHRYHFPPFAMLKGAQDLMTLAVDRAYQIFIKMPSAGDNEEQFAG